MPPPARWSAADRGRWLSPLLRRSDPAPTQGRGRDANTTRLAGCGGGS